MVPYSDPEYLSFTMDFRCDLRCTHCMIDETKFELNPTHEAKFQAMLSRERNRRRYRGIILTGAEVTLNKSLPRWVREARAAGFERVRVQTHGMRLSDLEFCETLIHAGVNEFFVSVIAATPETHDAIAQREGAFQRTMQGLRNLEGFDVCVLTNTVITTQSFRELPGVVQNLVGLRRLHRMEFWNYWPMAATDERDLLASVDEVGPYLREAVRRARSAGYEVAVKDFPACLLGEDSDAVQNQQPSLVIDRSFYDTFLLNEFGQCSKAEQCGHGQCRGFTTAYLSKFGEPTEQLRPISLSKSVASF